MSLQSPRWSISLARNEIDQRIERHDPGTSMSPRPVNQLHGWRILAATLTWYWVAIELKMSMPVTLYWLNTDIILTAAICPNFWTGLENDFYTKAREWVNNDMPWLLNELLVTAQWEKRRLHNNHSISHVNRALHSGNSTWSLTVERIYPISNLSIQKFQQFVTYL